MNLMMSMPMEAIRMLLNISSGQYFLGTSVGNTEKSAHVLNLGSHQEEGRRKNGDVMCIKGAAGEQAGCNTDPGPAGEPSGAQNGNGLTGKIKDAHDRAANFT